MAEAVIDSGLICAFLLDGKGGGKPLGWDEIYDWKPGKGTLWLHVDYTGPDSRRWLDEASGIDEITREALLAHDPRPRSVADDKQLLLIVRGVNMNQGAEPEDMVSMRIFADTGRIVTLRHRRNNAAKEARKMIEAKTGPRRVGQFLVTLIDLLLDEIARVSDDVDEVVSRLEDDVLTSDNAQLRQTMAEARRRAIALRRHVAPERDVLSKLQNERVGWLTSVDRARLGEMADRMTRILEDLDSARDRAAVTQEELTSRQAEQMNTRIYVLSIITAVFLPMGLITGVLGVNVGGIPLQDNPWGFVIVLGLMAALLVGLLVLFRVKRWL